MEVEDLMRATPYSKRLSRIFVDFEVAVPDLRPAGW